jgi:membrane protein implicated in regulation of membrane protease activity
MSLGTRLDVRIPIGAMFTLFGAIIAVFGLVSDPAIYQRSLNININLWWGLVMVAFGGVLLIMACRSARARKKTENR